MGPQKIISEEKDFAMSLLSFGNCAVKKQVAGISLISVGTGSSQKCDTNLAQRERLVPGSRVISRDMSPQVFRSEPTPAFHWGSFLTALGKI